MGSRCKRSLRRSLALAMAGLALCLSAGAVQAADECRKVIVSADPEFPPFAWYDGKSLRGASVDVVLAVLQAIKLPYEVRYVGPFVRVLQSAKLGEVDIVTELKRNPQREQFLSFTETSIFSNPTSVFVLASVPPQLAASSVHREALRGLRGGVTRGTRFGDGLDEYIEASLSVEEATGIRENFLKLEAHRIDYFISPYYPALSQLISTGEEARFVALKPFVAEALNYVGWSRRSPCLSRLEDFDAMLKRYLAGLNSTRLVNEYHAAWRRSPVMIR